MEKFRVTFSSFLFDCALLSWKCQYGKSSYGGRTVRRSHICLSVLGLNKAVEFWIMLLLSLKLFHINCEGPKKKKKHTCNNCLLTAHLWSSTSGEVPASPIDLESQYLHPLKLLADSPRGPSTEFHSSAGPSRQSRFTNAVLNLRIGPIDFIWTWTQLKPQHFAGQMFFYCLFQMQKYGLMWLVE